MSLKDVLGQNKAVEILLNEIMCNNVRHSYIFFGVSSIGKKFTAIQFVKSLLCETPKNGLSCDICETCLKIDEGIHPDVVVVDHDFQQRLLLKQEKTTTISIDTIRYLKQFSALTTYSGKYKIAIIDSAETLQKEAANSLLKLLEEPPKNFIIILITTSLGILPKTVLSRCEQIKFMPLNQKDLEEISKEESDKNFIMGSIKEIEYQEYIKKFSFDINSMSIYDIQIFVENITQTVDKEFIKYFFMWLIEKIFAKNFKEINKTKYEFLLEIESYIKEFKYNIDLRILLEAFLLKVKMLCNKGILYL